MIYLDRGCGVVVRRFWLHNNEDWRGVWEVCRDLWGLAGGFLENPYPQNSPVMIMPLWHCAFCTQRYYGLYHMQSLNPKP